MMVYDSWNEFCVSDNHGEYFVKLIIDKNKAAGNTDDKEFEDWNLSYVNVLFEDGHTEQKHVEISNSELLNRIISAPPMLGKAASFSSFLSLLKLRLGIADILSFNKAANEIFKWLVSDKTQKDTVGVLSFNYGDNIGKSIIFKDGKIYSAECDDFKMVIRRDKTGIAAEKENPFYFKIITAYPERGEDNELKINKELTEQFADKLIEHCKTNISDRLAWGQVLLNTEIAKVDEQGNILFDGKIEEGQRAKVYGIIRIPGEKGNFIGVSVSQREKMDLIYGNVSTGKVYPLSEEREIVFKDDIDLISSKFSFAWDFERFKSLVHNKILNLETMPEWDSEIALLSNGINLSLRNKDANLVLDDGAEGGTYNNPDKNTPQIEDTHQVGNTSQNTPDDDNECL